MFARAKYEQQLAFAGCEHPDGGWRCPSPRHRKPWKLSINETPLGIMLHCAGHCEAEAITAALQARLDEALAVVETEPTDGPKDTQPGDTVFPEEWASLEDADLDDEQTERLLKLLSPVKRSPATIAVELAEQAGVTLFHDESGNCYGSFEVDGHVQTHPISSRQFKGWLARLYYLDREAALSSANTSDSVALLTAKATHDNVEPIEVHLRVARDGNRIVVDLGDAHWRSVQVTRTGWELLDHHPLRFRRSGTMAALPEPRRGGKLDLLRGYLNIADEDQYRLIVAWLVAALHPGAPVPLLSLLGTAGSAKSSTARMLRSLVDPSRSPLRAPSRDVLDVMVSATSGWIVAYDNMSDIPQSMSDALCRLSTGGGLGKRRLYSDDEEIVLDAQRPVILTSIASAVTRGDLLSRSIMLELPRIDAGARRDETGLWQDFERDQPAIFAGLLDALAGVLDRIADVQIKQLPRMADFARLGVAVEQALGWQTGSFTASYMANIEAGDVLAVEHSPVGPAIRAVAKAGGFHGTMKDLLEKITLEASDATARAREWPKTPEKLAGELKRIMPNLRELGVRVERATTLVDGYRPITIHALDHAE